MTKTKRNKETWVVGHSCNYHAVIGGPITTTGHYIKAISVQNGHTVAWITGKSGFVAIEALSKPTDINPSNPSPSG